MIARRVTTIAEADALQDAADERAVKFLCDPRQPPYPSRESLHEFVEGELQNVYAAYEDDGTPICYCIVVTDQKQAIWTCVCDAFDRDPLQLGALYRFVKEDLGGVWGFVPSAELRELFVQTANVEKETLLVEGTKVTLL
jgi:hypothetical protein